MRAADFACFFLGFNPTSVDGDTKSYLELLGADKSTYKVWFYSELEIALQPRPVVLEVGDFTISRFVGDIATQWAQISNGVGWGTKKCQGAKRQSPHAFIFCFLHKVEFLIDLHGKAKGFNAFALRQI